MQQSNTSMNVNDPPTVSFFYSCSMEAILSSILWTVHKRHFIKNIWALSAKIDQSKSTIPESRVGIDDILSESHKHICWVFSGYLMDDCDGSPWIYLEHVLRHFSLIGVPFILLASLQKANKMRAHSYSLLDEFRFLSDTQESLKRSQSFQGTIIITRSLPQDEQCHYMLAEWTLSESVIHSSSFCAL